MILRKMAAIVLLSLIALGALYVAVARSSKGVEQGKVAAAWGAKRAPQVVEVAPDFTLSDLDGNDVRLSDFRGKVIFMSFWVTRCSSCKWQMPSMEALYQKLKGKDFELLAVSLDRRGASVVRSFALDYRLTFPILLDMTGKVGTTYGVQRFPTSFILDKEGIIVEKVVGVRDWASRDSIERFQRLISQD